MTLTTDEARAFLGRPVHGSDGERLGDVDGVYFNDAAGELEWVSFSADFVTGGHAFVPGTVLRQGHDQVSLPFDWTMLEKLPHIEPQDGALSNAQVARLHEFFGTFDGHTRITSATEGAPTSLGEDVDDPQDKLTGRGHETAFGTGTPGKNEPHDVTLQGTGNPAP